MTRRQPDNATGCVHVGAAIRKARTGIDYYGGWTQQHLADEASKHLKGRRDRITRSAIAAYENGTKACPMHRLRAIAAACRVTFVGVKEREVSHRYDRFAFAVEPVELQTDIEG